jgi:hypothetical protein
VTVSDILHLISPLCLRMPVYSSLLLALDGHSRTSLVSPGGALTLVHPVISAKSFFRCFDSASFHYSRSPLYLRFYISLVTLLYIYNQHDRSGSCCVDVRLVIDGLHFSVVLVVYVVVGCGGVGFCGAVVC